MSSLICSFVVATALSALTTGPLIASENILFPEGAVCDITKPPYNAKGDGKTNDTAAIQQALDEGKNLIYLPNGTYVVSNTLRWAEGNGGKPR